MYMQHPLSKRVGKEAHQRPPLNPCTDANAGIKRTVDALCLNEQIAVCVVASKARSVAQCHLETWSVEWTRLDSQGHLQRLTAASEPVD